VSTVNLHEFLGPAKALSEGALKRDQVGVATGLAWTAVGGEVLYVEALLLRGKGILQLTGQLGDVMKESAQAAFSYAKSRAQELGIAHDAFEKYDIHVHVPEGATPKDGPSAGVTMTTAIVSALSSRQVKRRVAMTGEITLRGNVLPIGGVKEKVLAAHRAKCSTVLLPAANKRDIDEVPKELLKELEFVFVDHINQVLRHALVQPEAQAAKPDR
jgi:ATP-dependent Lon protease